MYKAILMLSYVIARETESGSVASYTNKDKLFKIVQGVSEEDCRRKVEKFLAEGQFTGRKCDE